MKTTIVTLFLFLSLFLASCSENGHVRSTRQLSPPSNNHITSNTVLESRIASGSTGASNFKGQVYSYNNVNGKVNTLEKEFDDYASYESFMHSHPELQMRIAIPRIWEGDWFGTDFMWNSPFYSPIGTGSMSGTGFLAGVDLYKYQARAYEKERQAAEKRYQKEQLEYAKTYLETYLKENDDSEARADLEKIKTELKKYE